MGEFAWLGNLLQCEACVSLSLNVIFVFHNNYLMVFDAFFSMKCCVFCKTEAKI